jgi:hypothetical protein
MAMALIDELASLNIVVEKWDSSKIGAGKRGGSTKGKQGLANGLHNKGGHIQHTGASLSRGNCSILNHCLRACQLPLNCGSSPESD